MKIALKIKTLKTENKLNINYNYQIFGFITNMTDGLYHNNVGGKFTFYLDSNNNVVKNDEIIVKNDIILYISSHDNVFIETLKNNIKENKIYNFGNFYFTIDKIQIKDFVYDEKTYYLELLTPVIIQDDGKYLSPDDDKFLKIFENNIKKKTNDDKIQLQIIKDDIKRKKIQLKNKSFLIGYKFNFIIEFNDITNIKNVLDSGFGAKNQMGFGYVKILKCK